MKTITLLGVCWLALVAPAPGQVEPVQALTSQTVPITKQGRLDDELFRFLLSTHQADDLTAKPALFKVPLLRNAQHPGIGVYKFGIDAAHAGYNVVFQYRHQLVFSQALTAGPLQAQLQRFLAQYPTAFSPRAQTLVKGQLLDLVEHNQTAGESDLPDRKF